MNEPIGLEMNIPFTISRIVKDGEGVDNLRQNLWWAHPTGKPEGPEIMVCIDQLGFTASKVTVK